jgi:membrane protein implicated in regulation of membrane protease activity
MVVVWVLVGLALLGFELHHLAFYALFVAIGAFAAAGVAVAAPGAVVAQSLTIVLTSIIGITAARPFVSRAFEHRHTQQHVARGVHGGLNGQQAVTADVVGGTGRPGHVRLAGERWLAVSGDDVPIPPDTAVVVTAVTGTTLTVWPLSARELETDDQSNHAPDRAEEE